MSKATLAARVRWIGIILAPLLSGCVIIPVPLVGETYESYMDRKDRSFIEAGETNRQEVLEYLGSPTALSAGRGIWVYSIKDYLSMGWALCVMVLITPEGGACPTEFEGEEKSQFLEIEFDDAGIVSGRRVTSLATGECSKSGFCWDDQPAFVTVSGDRVKPDYHCAVHFYSADVPISAKLELPGTKAFDLSLNIRNFQVVLLQRREAQIVIRFDDGSNQKMLIPCGEVSANFVHISRKKGRYRVWLVPEFEGRPVIINKPRMIAINF